MNGGKFETNQLLFADDTALVADSEKTLCCLVSEFGRVWEMRKFESESIEYVVIEFISRKS